MGETSPVKREDRPSSGRFVNGPRTSATRSSSGREEVGLARAATRNGSSVMIRRRKFESAGGVILRRDVLAMGYDDRYIAARLRAKDWVRIRHGAYVATALWDELGVGDKHRVRARAVLRTAKSPVALSHVSSTLEWGGEVWDLDLDEV